MGELARARAEAQDAALQPQGARLATIENGGRMYRIYFFGSSLSEVHDVY